MDFEKIETIVTLLNELIAECGHDVPGGTPAAVIETTLRDVETQGKFLAVKAILATIHPRFVHDQSDDQIVTG